MGLAVFLALGNAAKPWTASYEQYGVTIVTANDSRRWDFSSTTVKGKLVTGEIFGGNVTILMRIFEPLLELDIPYGDPTTMMYGASVTRCMPRRQPPDCHEITTIYDFDWHPIELSNLTQGVIWRSYGAPNEWEDQEYPEWEIRVEFRCLESADDSDPTFQFDTTAGDGAIIVRYHDIRGCGVTPATFPSPTPSPYTPDCRAVFRDQTDSSYAIYADLSELNGGRFGEQGWIQFFVPGLTPMYLFFAPCERIVPCPWGADCGSDTMSSAWLCNWTGDGDQRKMTTCQSYGRLDSSPNFSLIQNGNLDAGFQWNVPPGPNTAKRTQVTATCGGAIPFGHFQIDFHSAVGGDVLALGIKAHEFCARTHPIPQPLTGCLYNETQPGWPNWEVRVDLSTYPNNTWRARRADWLVSPDYDLAYLPCNGMQCPAGKDCGGDEDAMIWLCERSSADPSLVPPCTAYGLHRHNIAVELTGNYVFYGIDVLYTGDDDRHANVHWRCDSSLPSGVLTFNGTFVLSESGTLHMEVSSSDVCAKGSGPTPTAPPRYVPDLPGEPPLPTPPLVESPWPIHPIFNATHYIVIDFERLDADPRLVEQTMWYNGHRSSVLTAWSPWHEEACPETFDCRGWERANLWECWLSDELESVCWPVAWRKVPGTHAKPLDPADFGRGVTIIYEGVWGVNMEINAVCNQVAGRGLPILDKPVVYHKALSGAEWVFEANSFLACPRRYEIRPIPTAPRAPPPPKPQKTWKGSWRPRHLKNQQFGLDVKKLQPIIDSTISELQHVDAYTRRHVHYSPVDRTGCPAGANCSIYAKEKANVWLCGQRVAEGPFSQCYPIGDANYGMNVTALNTEDHHHGVRVTYAGGVGDHMNLSLRTTIDFFCNESLDWEQVVYRPVCHGDHCVGFSRENWTSFVIFAETREVCLRPVVPPGGAIFLAVVGGLGLAYFVLGGFLTWVLGGGIVPHADFWGEVRQCVVAPFTFVFKCGAGADGLSYDKI